MKRLACLLALLWSIAAGASTRYRINIDTTGADDPATLIRQLTSMARVEPSDVRGDTFVVAASDAALRVLRSDPRVLRVETIETTATTTWNTGTYAYDAAGNVKSIGADKFVYDGFGRLTSGMAAGQRQSYTYDRFGNLRTITTGTTIARLGADAATNRLSQSAIAGQSQNAFGTYDAAGQLISWNHSGGTFSYDGLGMIATSSGMRYIYTPSEERLVSMTVSGTTEVSSEWTLRDTSGKVLRRLTRANGTWTWRQDYVYLNASLLAAEVDTSAKTLHFFPDHLGTPRVITNNGGTQVGFHTYFPFGEEATASAQDAERLKFTGHERDASGLDYMHARYYGAGVGRFLSVDPTWESADFRTPQSWNRYTYGLNNPILNTDPDGKVCAPCIGALAGGAIGLIAGGAYETYAVIKEGRPVNNKNIFAAGAVGAALGLGAGMILAPDACACEPAKRGPKIDPSAPHNAQIRDVGERVTDGTIIAGGGQAPERLIPTPGGHKDGRRPDILVERPNGEVYGVNVGKTEKSGLPVKREREAIEDLEGAGVEMHYVPYDRPVEKHD